jgi:hypothetical protein
MSYLDPKTRSRIVLNPSHSPSLKCVNTFSSSCFQNIEYVLRANTPPSAIFSILLSGSLHIIALYSGKEWQLERGVASLWLLSRVLGVGGVGAGIWWAVTAKVPRRLDVRSVCLQILPREYLIPCLPSGTPLLRLPSSHSFSIGL